MRAVVQRVSRASVTVDDEPVSEIAMGLLVLLGVADDDADKDAQWMAAKLAGLRIFADDEGKMNRSVTDVGGEVLVVSQFTLLGDARKGTRPSFAHAAPPAEGERLYELTMKLLGDSGLSTKGGRFGAMMDVELVNDGPVTILLDSKKKV